VARVVRSARARAVLLSMRNHLAFVRMFIAYLERPNQVCDRRIQSLSRELHIESGEQRVVERV
jgi:hypothetical protein